MKNLKQKMDFEFKNIIKNEFKIQATEPDFWIITSNQQLYYGYKLKLN